jgi:protein SCO1/2
MKKNKTAIFLTVFFMVLGIAFLGYYYYAMPKRAALDVVEGDRNHHIGAFSFTNQDGKTITNEDVKGKIYVVEYFFTTCKGICPKMNENMVKVYQAFRGDPDVLILSHTVDPKKDTVAAMKAYSNKFDADASQWMFLTGGKKELYDMARNSYLITAADDTATTDIQSDFIHTNHFVLVDRLGRIRGHYYDGTDSKSIAQLINDIKDLKKE